jgi:hypothetical protein
MEESGCSLLCMVLPGICLDRLMKTMKNLSQDTQSLGRDMNPESRIQSRNTNH